MNGFASPLLRRALALAILAGCVALAWTLVVAPLIGLSRDRQADIAAASEQVRHLDALIARKPVLDRRASALVARVAATGGFWSGPSAAVIAASMQDRLRQVVASSGGRVESSADAARSRTTVFASWLCGSRSGPLATVQRALEAVAAATPALFVEHLAITAPVAARDPRTRRSSTSISPSADTCRPKPARPAARDRGARPDAARGTAGVAFGARAAGRQCRHLGAGRASGPGDFWGIAARGIAGRINARGDRRRTGHRLSGDRAASAVLADPAALAAAADPGGPCRGCTRSAASFTVIGTVIGDGVRRAIVRPPNGDKTIVLAEGQILQGWTLRRIGHERLRFENDGATYELRFPPPVRARSRRPADSVVAPLPPFTDGAARVLLAALLAGCDGAPTGAASTAAAEPAATIAAGATRLVPRSSSTATSGAIPLARHQASGPPVVVMEAAASSHRKRASPSRRKPR